MKEGNYYVSEFINKFTFEDSPQEVKQKVKICVMDLIGSLIAGSQTNAFKLASKLSQNIWSGRDSTILLENKRCNCIGATFANSVAANAIDIDDGFRLVKGHPGSLIIPAALAVGESLKKSGKEVLEAIIVGYEVGTRAGMIWHDYYPMYHASGSWGALASAATTAKLLNLSIEKTISALGIAEYQAPINPIMRCIDHPSMVKDGIAWGSQTGVSSALMAQEGYTGILSIFSFKKYFNQISDLGKKYNILNLYFKPYACCRWAQPAVEGVLKLVNNNSIETNKIKQIKIYTFKESARLSTKIPCTTEEAQYNIVFPIAAAVCDGQVGPKQVLEERLNDKNILGIIEKIKIFSDNRFDKKFPLAAESEVEIIDINGNVYKSGIIKAKGDVENPLSEDELKNKFFWLAEHYKQNSDKIFDTINNLEKLENIEELINLI